MFLKTIEVFNELVDEQLSIAEFYNVRGFLGKVGLVNARYFIWTASKTKIGEFSFATTIDGSGRFPGSGLHIPLPGGEDPAIKPWGPGVYHGQPGSFFTAHYDSSNPLDDLVGFTLVQISFL